MDKIGEDTEKSALPWDVIKQSTFVPVADLAATKVKLKELHDQRMAKSEEYKMLQQDIQDMKKREKEVSVSLNMVKLKAERDSLEAKSLARTNQIRALRGLTLLKKGDKSTKEERFDFVEDESLKVMADLMQIK